MINHPDASDDNVTYTSEYQKHLLCSGIAEKICAAAIAELKHFTAGMLEENYQRYMRTSVRGIDLDSRTRAKEYIEAVTDDPRVLSHMGVFKVPYLDGMCRLIGRDLTMPEHDLIAMGSNRGFLYHLWEQKKIAYHVSPRLWQAMKTIDYPTDFPLSELQIPSDFGLWLTPDGPFVHSIQVKQKGEPLSLVINGIMESDRMYHVYEKKERDMDPVIHDIWHAFFADDPYLLCNCASIDLTSETVGERFSYVTDEKVESLFHAAGIPTPAPEKDNSHRVISKPFLNLLFYLSGQPDICAKYPHEKPEHIRKSAIPSEVARKRKPKEYTVGERYDLVLQKIEERTREESIRTGRKLRPHVKSGHFRTYYTGKGRAQVQKLFIVPYATGGLTLADFPEFADKEYFSVLIK